MTVTKDESDKLLEQAHAADKNGSETSSSTKSQELVTYNSAASYRPMGMWAKTAIGAGSSALILGVAGFLAPIIWAQVEKGLGNLSHLEKVALAALVLLTTLVSVFVGLMIGAMGGAAVGACTDNSKQRVFEI